HTVETVLRFLDDSAPREETLKTGKGEPYYLALWATAFDDVHVAIRHAAATTKDPEVERRFVAVHFLGETRLLEAQAAMVGFLDDADLRIVVRALADCPSDADLFDKVLEIQARLPEKPTNPTGPVWPWVSTRVSREAAGEKLVAYLGKRPVTVLLPLI